MTGAASCSVSRDHADRTPPCATWVRCDLCEDWWCYRHGQHVYDCDCPPIEEWTYDPYTEWRTPVDHGRS
jgi:hypothetical protein